jgi:hypothetical protein
MHLNDLLNMWKKKIKLVNHYMTNIFFSTTNFISSSIDANNGGTSGLVQSLTDFPNRIIPSHVNTSIPPEQALRLYTQYIHEVCTSDFPRIFKIFRL